MEREEGRERDRRVGGRERGRERGREGGREEGREGGREVERGREATTTDYYENYPTHSSCCPMRSQVRGKLFRSKRENPRKLGERERGEKMIGGKVSCQSAMW